MCSVPTDGEPALPDLHLSPYALVYGHGSVEKRWPHNWKVCLRIPLSMTRLVAWARGKCEHTSGWPWKFQSTDRPTRGFLEEREMGPNASFACLPYAASVRSARSPIVSEPNEPVKAGAAADRKSGMKSRRTFPLPLRGFRRVVHLSFLSGPISLFIAY